MKLLLGVQEITVDVNGEIFIKESTGSAVGIVLVSAACRKLFTVFVLLHCLIEATDRVKLLLMEEPESQLHPTLHPDLMDLLIQVTKEEKIQLIATTNSQETLKMFKPEVGIL